MSQDETRADSTEENLEEGENLEENTSEEADDSSDDEESKKFEDQKRRAEKAEAKLQELRERLSSDKDEDKDDDKQLKDDRGGLTKDEAKLIARGLSDEEIEKADKIAQVEGVSLAEAVNTDLFETWKSRRDEEKKAQEASIGASKGSGSQKKGKTLQDKNLTKEEHKKLAKERMGM